MIGFMNAFVKITGWLPYLIVFRTRIHYEDKKAQGRRIKGKAIIISNHTSVYDYAVFIFTFPFRTLRYQMAEVLFKKKGLGLFLRSMGGIFVDRDNPSIEPILRSEEILRRGGIVGIFPEGRIPKEEEKKPLEFKGGAAKIALMSDSPIIPVYTDGSYFNSKRRANVLIGKPIRAMDYYDERLSEVENLKVISEILRKRIREMGVELDERKKK